MAKLTSSPWGAVQQQHELAEGIIGVSTASHGGIKVSDELLAKMPAEFRTTPYSGGGWFEEDCDWALVAVCFPYAFHPNQVAEARDMIANVYPTLVKYAPVAA